MRWVAAAAVFLMMTLAGHLAILNSIPTRIMSAAQDRMAKRGVEMYQWVASPRLTPQTQTLLRPSPDLAYAICRFDVNDGPVLLTAPTYQAYGSLSVFDAQSDNVFTASLRQGSGFKGVIVHAPGEEPAGRQQAQVAMSGKGIALIRRLAPDEKTHGRATELAAEARCDQIAPAH